MPMRRACSTTCIGSTCSPIDAAASGDPVYQFHALFREFLLDEGRKRLTPDERRAALDRAGGQLVVARRLRRGGARCIARRRHGRALMGLALAPVRR